MDDDGVPDSSDDLPNDPTEDTDTDGDGVGNNADLDDDNDGIVDEEDPFPLDPATTDDADGDGIKDIDDDDLDGDGVRNSLDAFPLDPTEKSDSDGDGIGDNRDVRPFDGRVFATQFLQTTSASQNISSLSILNTSDRDQTFTGTLRNGDGKRRGSRAAGGKRHGGVAASWWVARGSCDIVGWFFVN